MKVGASVRKICEKCRLIRRRPFLLKYYPCLCLCFGLEQITIIRKQHFIDTLFFVKNLINIPFS